jgi:hypothetical protein
MFCFFFFFRQSRLNEISNNICSCCPGKFGFDTCLGSCSIVGSKGPKTTLFLIGFLTPCLAIVISYAGIFWTVNKWADILSCSGHHLSPQPIDGGRFFFFFFSFPGREREFRDMPERPLRLPVALEAIGAWLKWSSSFSFRSSSATCPPPSSRLWTRKLNVPVSGHIFDLTNYHGP